MKRIAINALGLKSNTGGVESYTYNNVKALLDNDSENQYYLFIGENVENIFQDLKIYKNLKIIVHPINTNNSSLRVVWESTVLAASFLKYRINLAHHIGNYLPWICPVKSVVTIHDLVPYFYNEFYPQYQVTQKFYNYFKKAVKHTVKKADKIIVISEFTKKELLRFFEVEHKKIEVVGQSLDTRKTKFTAQKETLEKNGIQKPYLLSVSVIRPHKNLDFLIRSFNLLKEKYNIPHQLVIAGGVHFGAETLFEEMEKSPYASGIKYLGFTSNQDLATIYTFADAFVFPSKYEGFGIPLLEAMEYKIPVVSSKEASLKEVGSNACVYFDPYDEKDACEKIYSLINDNSLREKLLKEAEIQTDNFSWDKVASKLLKVYDEVL